MNEKLTNICDFTSTGFGLVGVNVSIGDLSNILNVILLAVSILNIVLVLSLRIYNAFKKNDIKELQTSLTDAKEKLEVLKNELDKKQ